MCQTLVEFLFRGTVRPFWKIEMTVVNVRTVVEVSLCTNLVLQVTRRPLKAPGFMSATAACSRSQRPECRLPKPTCSSTRGSLKSSASTLSWSAASARKDEAILIEALLSNGSNDFCWFVATKWSSRSCADDKGLFRELKGLAVEFGSC